jgi:hypothetical protein
MPVIISWHESYWYNVKVENCRYWLLERKKVPVLIPWRKEVTGTHSVTEKISSNKSLTQKSYWDSQRDSSKVSVLTPWQKISGTHSLTEESAGINSLTGKTGSFVSVVHNWLTPITHVAALMSTFIWPCVQPIPTHKMLTGIPTLLLPPDIPLTCHWLRTLQFNSTSAPSILHDDSSSKFLCIFCKPPSDKSAPHFIFNAVRTRSLKTHIPFCRVLTVVHDNWILSILTFWHPSFTFKF